MALGGKKKTNPSSRYSRMEEPWLDDTGEERAEDSSFRYEDEGYGVRDSYSRQASYGRPEGYYDPYRAPEPGDTRVMPDREELRSAARAKADAGRGQKQRSRTQSSRRQDYNADAWDDPEYDDRYDAGRTSRRADRRSGADRYADEERYAYDGRYDDRTYDDGDAVPAGAGRGTHDGRRSGKRSRTGFIVKLVLLLIAAAALLIVWRFSRMERTALKDILTNSGITGYSGFQDFVIYGVDSREGNLTSEAHSDTIIICSMNKASKEIRMVSVYRDTYLDNTNGEYRKATECYYFGGPSRSVSMLNKNLDLDLKDYITVDFNAVVKAVDLIGGIDVEVTEEELPYINGYQTENAQVTGAQITPVTSAGWQHLNGIQTLAYCRIRYTAGSDYRRTERQRTVLTQVFEQARKEGPVKLAQIVDAMLPDIATSFSNAELLSLATGLPGYTLGESAGFPFDLQAANISAGDCVVPVNLAQNVTQLHAFLYRETGYVPSDTVRQISDEIASSTGIY